MRLEKIRSFLIKERIDAFVLFSKSPSFAYLLPSFNHGVLLVLKSKTILLVNDLYRPKIKGVLVINFKHFEQAFDKSTSRFRRVAIDESNILYRQRKFLASRFKVVDGSEILHNLRAQKTEQEIENIKKACRETDKIFAEFIADYDFKREEQAASYIKMRLVERGLEPSFEPITASGPNAAIAHHDNKGKIRKGFMVIDFGARYKGYCADMTRTIHLGRPEFKHADIYEKILEVQQECLLASNEGTKAKELFALAVKRLGPDAKYFNHGLGHGIGVEIHESPSISPLSKDVLRANNVITIEPGYYNQAKGIGIRIEDDVLVGKTPKVLTRSPKELIIIP